MKLLCRAFLGGGLYLVTSFGISPALAEKSQINSEPKKTDSAGPTKEDLSRSTSRGLFVEPMPGLPLVRPQAKKVPKSQTKSTAAIPKTETTVKGSIVKYKTSAKPAIVAKAKKHKIAAPESHIAVVKNPVKMVSSSETALLNNSEQIVAAWLNKKGPNPGYKNREKMRINVQALKDCNLMIFDFDGQGKLTQIFPNDYQQNSLIHAGETVCIGGEDSPFEYQVSIPKGQSKAKESIFVYAYPTTAAPLAVAMNHLPNAPFRGTEMNMEQYRKLVNQSKVYFARGIDIIPKKGAKLASSQSPMQSPNKIELSFSIDR